MNDIPVFAFPIHPDVDLSRDQIWGGMTLRDYFAARAMQAMITHPDSRADVHADIYAKGAYVMADAMMKARDAQA